MSGYEQVSWATLPRLDFRNEARVAPTGEMWEAMKQASMAFELSSVGTDPTVLELERIGAEITGQEAAYLLPSTTAATMLAMVAAGVRAKQIIMESKSHLFWLQRFHETVYAGAYPLCIDGGDAGVMPLESVRAALNQTVWGLENKTAFVCIENTHNICGGTPLTPEYTEQIAGIAHTADAQLFIDGARIWNAAVALDVEVADLCKPADAVVLSLNKAPLAPYGALLCGSRQLISNARAEAVRTGANQVHKSSIFAAAAIVGLRGIDERLRADHSRARWLAEELAGIPGLSVNVDATRTNLVRVDTTKTGVPALDIATELSKRDLALQVIEPDVLRLVTYASITDDDIAEAISIFREVSNKFAG